MNTVRQGIVMLLPPSLPVGFVSGYWRGRKQFPVSTTMLLTLISWQSIHARTGPQPRAPTARNGRREPGAHRNTSLSTMSASVLPR